MAVLLSGVALAACSSPVAESSPPTAVTAVPAQPVTVLAEDEPVALAVATSELLYREAPVVVLAGAGDDDGRAAAAEAATGAGAPLLLTPAGPGTAQLSSEVRAELDRLAPTAVLAVGEQARAWAAEAAGSVEVVTDAAELPAVEPAGPLDGVVVLAGAPGQASASATARAAGARVLESDSPDPRADAEVVEALAAAPPERVVAFGSEAGPPERLRERLAVATGGVQLPGGGQLVFPGRRMVALYGNPTTAALGVLGEQGVEESIARVGELAAAYQPYSDVPVVPAFEIITTVASTAAGADGDYSAESEVSLIRPYVDAAREAGVYVVLDLQPGRSDFLSQAQRYEELLAEPHVGLALDPEWRLGPGQLHLAQIGSVGADEVNAVVDWLADLTRERVLPQKLLLLHQFRTSMIGDRAAVDTSRDELAVLVHADGFGTPGLKLETWSALRAEPMPGAFWGWKNFIDEDSPTLTPEQTLAVHPDVVFVSYQ